MTGYGTAAQIGVRISLLAYGFFAAGNRPVPRARLGKLPLAPQTSEIFAINEALDNMTLKQKFEERAK